MKFALHALAACCAMALLDTVFAVYVAAIASRAVFSAAATAAMIQVMNSIIVVSYVRDRRLIVPVAVGAFIGTWAGLELF